jgi:hypothetical protein
MAEMSGVQHHEQARAPRFNRVAAQRTRAARKAAAELRAMAGLEPEIPNYGRRSGVPAPEIADTIEDIFDYLHRTKRESPSLIEAIDKEASAWHEQVEWLRDADQPTLDRFFGQPSKTDVETALAEQGITRENTPEEDYRGKWDSVAQELQIDAGAYWPGEVVPTLREYRELLQFDAYRYWVLVGLPNSSAAKLIRRLDAFEGAFGATHLAFTQLSHEIGDYINGTERHPSEVYAEPDGVLVDYLNAFHHTYNASISWAPSDDMSTVTAMVGRGGGGERKNASLALERAKFDVALARGGISPQAKVVLGDHYGEDAIRVTMSMDEYTRRYLPILRGEVHIDTSYRLESRGGLDRAPMNTVDVFRGYEPGKPAFYDGQDVLVDANFLGSLEVDMAGDTHKRAARALRFLREAGAVRETGELVTTLPGSRSEFVRLSPEFRRGGDDVYLIDGKYYSSTDMQNQISRSLGVIQGAAAGQSLDLWARSQKRSVHDHYFFSHDGDMYIPQGDRSYQLALHIQHKYGAKHTWVIHDPRAKGKAGGRDMYVIQTSKLSITARREAKAEIRAALEGIPVRGPKAVNVQVVA